MATKKLQNNFTTQEQSEKLLAMGIPANTADFYYERHSEIKFERMNIRLNKIELADDFFEKHSLYTPHWSTGRLIEIFDMCYQREPEESITEHWILTQEATENFGSYIEYLVQTFCVQKKFLDFSKLEE